MLISPKKNAHFCAPFKKNNRFYNHEFEKSRHVFVHSCTMFIKSWLKRRFFPAKANFKELFKENSPQNSSGNIAITWIGHSTFLITIDGITFLTDPIFGNASLLFRRHMPPGIPLHELPKIDYVVLSHNHRDHMDAKSLQHIRQHQPKIVVPHGDKPWFKKRSFSQVYEAEWWQELQCSERQDLRFYFLPAYHWSQRALFDKNRSLWGSWLIEYKNYRIYFGGDTAYWHHFEQIAQQFPVIDIALLPIGPCEPRVWMQKSHMNAQEAGEAFLTLNAQHFIPMHWGTFHFGLDARHTPLEYLCEWWQEHQPLLHNKHLYVPQAGKTLFFNSDRGQKIIAETYSQQRHPEERNVS